MQFIDNQASCAPSDYEDFKKPATRKRAASKPKPSPQPKKMKTNGQSTAANGQSTEATLLQPLIERVEKMKAEAEKSKKKRVIPTKVLKTDVPGADTRKEFKVAVTNAEEEIPYETTTFGRKCGCGDELNRYDITDTRDYVFYNCSNRSFNDESDLWEGGCKMFIREEDLKKRGNCYCGFVANQYFDNFACTCSGPKGKKCQLGKFMREAEGSGMSKSDFWRTKDEIEKKVTSK